MIKAGRRYLSGKPQSADREAKPVNL